jgi:allophanate hydrolase
VLDVVAASLRVALVGGSAGLAIEGQGTVVAGRSVRLTRGDRIRCGPLRDVSCGYLAVEGGIEVPPVLGSAATYVRSHIGGLHGGVLRAGDVLPVRDGDAAERPETMLARPFDPDFAAPIRVVLGPQDDYFTEVAVQMFLSATYTISSQSDRMGYRLQGPALAHAGGYDIVSDGIVPGSIQVPGSGQPIVLLADSQTTGGYPKIATVISADLPLIGRRRPGAEVRFVTVTQEQAEQARREQERVLAQWIGDMQEVTTIGIDESALHRRNLIDGISDGGD